MHPAHAAWLHPQPLALDAATGQPALAPYHPPPPHSNSDAALLALRHAGLLLGQTGTARVWALRALVTHRRALPGRRLTTALWVEGRAVGAAVVEVGGVYLGGGGSVSFPFWELGGGGCSFGYVSFGLRKQELQRRRRRQEEGGQEGERAYDDWATRLWLEWGLAQHHFQVCMYVCV